MNALFKYAVVLASGLAIGFTANRPMSLDQVMKLPRVDEINTLIDGVLSRLKPKADSTAVDSTAASRVDEELDYLIAKRNGTLDGWQAFLAAHASGAHAESAGAEVDKLSLHAQASQPATAEVSDSTSSEANTESEAAKLDPPSEAPALPPHEVCNRDGDCPREPRSNPSSGDTAGVTNESTAGKPRMQVASLIDSVAAAPAEPNSSAKIGPDLRSRPRATALHRIPTVSSHIIPAPRERRCALRSECYWKTQTLPPILMALFGVKTKHSTKAFGRTVEAKPEGGQAR
jgi:hypothetical protein